MTRGPLNRYIDANGVDQDVSPSTPLPVTGAGTAGSPSGGVQSVQGVSGGTPIPVVGGTDYETVAASQTDQVLGATGATGDRLDILWVVPATTSPGNVQIKDGSGSAITVFTGGAGSVVDLRPQPIVLGIKSTGGAWKVTTGANVSVIGCGKFT
jgi:hypothetical protein